MAFTEPLFDAPLDNKMAGGPTQAAFKNPDSSTGSGSGVVPPNDAPAIAAIGALSALTGTGSNPATIDQVNAMITALNARLAAVEALRVWLVQSGAIKPPSA